MLVIIDYGMGNLRSVQKALESLGAKAVISDNPQDLAKATKVILPGVGAFGQAMENLQKKNFIEPLKAVLKSGKPMIGICLGMQLLMAMSEEHGPVKGLDLVKGSVDFFRSNKNFDKNLVVPHMGWNTVNVVKETPLFSGMPKQFEVYFVHSYYVNPKEAVTIGTTDYGINFCSALQKDNIYGIQFHPEKSSTVGLQILKNFVEKC